MLVTKQIAFEAAHRLEDWINSKCYRLHGHSWKLEATFEKALQDQDYCVVVDYSVISKLLHETIFEKVDHQYLNEVLHVRNPTSEFVAIWAFDKIFQGMKAISDFDRVELVNIRLYETSTAWADYGGKF